jgi:hydrogenase maturation protease
MKRTLIAGFGNVLRGDDGFGVAVVRRLAERGALGGSVALLDVGTGGIRLAQELMSPFDRLIIVDASTRGGSPGTVYTLVIEDVQPTREIDMHTAVPSRALEVARALGPLPAEIFFVGCEPASVDDLTTDLSPVVAPAVDEAIRQIDALLARDGGDRIAHEDELLELLYWFEGERFAGASTLESIVRFTGIADARRTLERLIGRSDVLLDASTGEYHLTESGRREAARRFAEEFAPLLAQGHGECNDPDCDCHTREGGAADCHARSHDHQSTSR